MTIDRQLIPGVRGMHRFLLSRGLFALVVTMGLIMMSVPIYCADNIQDLEDEIDMDMGSHDYIMDKQPSLNCSMVKLTDEELSNVTGAGFSQFSITDNVTKAYFNIEAATFTEINSLKMGYYHDGTSTGWDQDWTSVSLGSPTESLMCKGVYIEAGFSNISNSATRTLTRIKVGTPSMTGPISATFNSFSGRIEDRTTNPGTVLVPVEGRRLNLGFKTINANNSEFFIQLSTTPTTLPGGVTIPSGWYCYWSDATII